MISGKIKFILPVIFCLFIVVEGNSQINEGRKKDETDVSWAHNPKATSSNLVPATKHIQGLIA